MHDERVAPQILFAAMGLEDFFAIGRVDIEFNDGQIFFLFKIQNKEDYFWADLVRNIHPSPAKNCQNSSA